MGVMSGRGEADKNVDDKKICNVPFLEDLQKDNIYQILKNVDMDVINFLMSLLQN